MEGSSGESLRGTGSTAANSGRYVSRYGQVRCKGNDGSEGARTARRRRFDSHVEMVQCQAASGLAVTRLPAAHYAALR